MVKKMKHGKLVKINANENRKSLEQSNKNLLQFGISFLDDCFFGIKKNDLISIGAESGHGKTQLGTMIACTNARQGKNVFYFALEAYEREIERRISYQIAANEYFKDSAREKFDVAFPLYENNIMDKRFLPYAIYGEQQTEKLFSENLNIVHRGMAGYNVNHFVEEFEILDLEADLIIIDHIGYMDEIGNLGERKSLSYAIKKINEMVNIHEVPVIVITHIKSPKYGDNKLVPDQHSIFGSSDIAKESSKVAFICRDGYSQDNNNKQDYDSHLFPTYIHPAKSRSFGIINTYVGCIDYNIKNNQYENKYIVGKLNSNKDEIIYMQGDRKPFWAKRGV